MCVINAQTRVFRSIYYPTAARASRHRGRLSVSSRSKLKKLHMTQIWSTCAAATSVPRLSIVGSKVRFTASSMIDRRKTQKKPKILMLSLCSLTITPKYIRPYFRHQFPSLDTRGYTCSLCFLFSRSFLRMINTSVHRMAMCIGLRIHPSCEHRREHTLVQLRAESELVEKYLRRLHL